jgi:predicted RNase H-related nuclease YkuK (DUF458 family)
MEKYFRTQEGELVNIVEHTLEQLEKWPNLTIYIGSDSQVDDGRLVYATSIVFRYGTRGAHHIFHIEDVDRIKDDFLRLYNEGVRTVETYDLLTEELPVVATLEFDYNNMKKTLSSNLVSIFKGYHNAKFKSGEMLATKSADHICRHWKEIRHSWKMKDDKQQFGGLRVA